MNIPVIHTFVEVTKPVLFPEVHVIVRTNFVEHLSKSEVTVASSITFY
jgi:hypothetical protein